MSFQQPTQGHLYLNDIKTKIEQGDLVIPDFQRDFVWSVQQSASLLDSWIKGYPLGAFILWVSKEKLNIIKKVGTLKIANQENLENPLTYILDGQQRITSIYAAIMGKQIDNKRDFSKIIVNLDVNGLEDEIITILTDETDFTYITFKDLFDYNLVDIVQKYQSKPDYLKKINDYHDLLLSFSFPTIKIENVDLNTATEIFTRLNTGGKPLTVFEIMIAKTYQYDVFNLKDKIQNMVEEHGDYVDFDGYKDVVLKSISACLKGDTKQKTILSLAKEDIISNFNRIDKAFKFAINYFKNTLKIPTSGLFPYSVMLIPYTYFFYKLNPSTLSVRSPLQDKQLLDYFWRCVLTERFQSSSDTKLTEDIKLMEKILNGEIYEGFAPIDINVKKFIENGEFKMGRAYIKGLVCLLVSNEPHSLYDNSSIIFDSGWPVKTNSNNYHHFFPKKSECIKLDKFSFEDVNNICNIVLCDAVTNQVLIKDKNPSIYIPELQKSNPELERTLKKHYIDDITGFGLSNDNYAIFREQRAKSLLKSIRSKLIITDKDNIEIERNDNK